MKNSIDIALIDPNPHRDLARNPISPEQVDAIIESIGRTGFWDNLVARPVGDRYQLAYGHNRWEALKKLGIATAEFSVRDLTDYDMLNCMIDENETQRSITPAIVFENLTAALRLGERMLNACETVEQFNAMLENPMCPNLDTSKYSPQQFGQAKAQLASGEGLGRGFIKDFLGDRKGTGNSVVQTVIDSYYAESRKAAAEKKRKEQEAIAQAKLAEERKQRETERAERAEKDRLAAEAQRAEDERKAKMAAAKAAQDQVEKERLEQEAEAKREEAIRLHHERKAKDEAAELARKAAVAASKERQEAEAKAKHAQAKEQRMEFAGIARELLERLPTQGHMQMVASLIKNQKIPHEWHERLINACLEGEWSVNNPSRPNSVINRGTEWWGRVNGLAKSTKDKESLDKWLRFHPFDNIISAVNKAIGSTSALETAVKNGGDGFVRYDRDDLLKQLQRLEDYADNLLEAIEGFKTAIDGNGVIDSSANVVELKRIAQGA